MHSFYTRWNRTRRFIVGRDMEADRGWDERGTE